MTILDPWESGSPSTNSRGVFLSFSTHPSPESRVATFEMSWDEVCRTFEGAYFSWDPAAFPHQLSFHGCVRTALLSFPPPQLVSSLSESGHEKMMALQTDTVRSELKTFIHPVNPDLIRSLSLPPSNQIPEYHIPGRGSEPEVVGTAH